MEPFAPKIWLAKVSLFRRNSKQREDVNFLIAVKQPLGLTSPPGPISRGEGEPSDFRLVRDRCSLCAGEGVKG